MFINYIQPNSYIGFIMWIASSHIFPLVFKCLLNETIWNFQYLIIFGLQKWEFHMVSSNICHSQLDISSWHCHCTIQIIKIKSLLLHWNLFQPQGSPFEHLIHSVAQALKTWALFSFFPFPSHFTLNSSVISFSFAWNIYV